MQKSTRDKIKKEALSLFAKKGFYGTTMNDIAERVGIKKPSLYAHFAGKEELFFEVNEDLAKDYHKLMVRLLRESEGMKPDLRLAYMFEHYIKYYLENREIQFFWNQITWFLPSELRERFGSVIMHYESGIEEKIVEILREGMDTGLIKNDLPARLVMSYRAMREGLLNWMIILPQLEDRSIKEYWNDYWQGIKKSSRLEGCNNEYR